MPLYPGPNIASFQTFFGTPGESTPKWSNTTYWEAASTQITSANALAAATSYHGQYSGVVIPLMASTVSVLSTRVRVFTSTALIEAEYAEVVDGEAATTESLPRQDTIVIQRKTGKFGRSYQGRIFLSGIAETCAVNGEIANASRADAKAVATFLGADRTFSVPYHARHWNRKMNSFEAITSCYAIIELKSRRDRSWAKFSTKI